MKTCPESRQLFDYLMDELPLPEREVVERHLGACAACRAALEAMAETRTLLDERFEELTPQDIPYRLWEAPSKTQTIGGRRWPLIASAACVVLALFVTQKMGLRCGTGEARAARFAQYQPEPVSDALEDWNEKRMTVTLIQEGSPQATVIHTALSPDKITQETISIDARGMRP